MNPNRENDSPIESADNEAILKEIQTLFMRTESVVRGTRITRKGDIVQPVDDLAGGIEGIMRVFKHDLDAVKAETLLSQIQSQLTQRFKIWEAETQQLQRAKVEVHNSPSGDQLRKMAAEVAMVKTSVSTALSKIRALATALSQFHSYSTKSKSGELPTAAELDLAGLTDFEKLVAVLLDGSFDFSADDGQKIGFGSRTREMIFDRKKKLFFVVQWSQWGSGKLELKLWLMPKSPTIVDAMPERIFDRLELSTSSGDEPIALGFENGGIENHPLPEQHDIAKFINAIVKKRFSTRPFQFLFASLQLDIPFSDAVLDETYRISLVGKKPLA